MMYVTCTVWLSAVWGVGVVWGGVAYTVHVCSLCNVSVCAFGVVHLHSQWLVLVAQQYTLGTLVGIEFLFFR